MTGLIRMGRAERGRKFRECVGPMIPFNQHQYIREEGCLTFALQIPKLIVEPALLRTSFAKRFGSPLSCHSINLGWEPIATTY